MPPTETISAAVGQDYALPETPETRDGRAGESGENSGRAVKRTISEVRSKALSLHLLYGHMFSPRTLAAAPATNDADKTPLPISTEQPSSPPREVKKMGGGGDGGDGGGSDGPPERKTPDIFEVSCDIQTAIDELSDSGFSIEAVTLENDFESKGRTRRDILSPLRVHGLKSLQNNPKLRALGEEAEHIKFRSEIARRLYVLEKDGYRSHGMQLENYRRALGYGSLLEMLTRNLRAGDILRAANIVDIAGGNANILRLALEKHRQIGIPMEQMGIMRGAKPKVGNTWFHKLQEAVNEVLSNGRFRYQFLTNLDISEPFTDKASSKGMNGIPVDVCSRPEEFVQALLHPPASRDPSVPEPHALQLNDTDIVHCHMSVDRLSDLDATIDNMRLLARLDKTTDYIIGTPLPISNVSDNESRNDNIPNLAFWDAEAKGDPRRLMMHDRKDAIVAFATYLNLKGLPVSRIAEYPSHEIVSLHCIVEEARTLRQEYPELQQREFFDPELTEIIRDLFAPEGDPRRTPDDELVCIPQEYQIVYFSGKITRPLDASGTIAALQQFSELPQE